TAICRIFPKKSLSSTQKLSKVTKSSMPNVWPDMTAGGKSFLLNYFTGFLTFSAGGLRIIRQQILASALKKSFKAFSKCVNKIVSSLYFYAGWAMSRQQWK